MIIPIRCFTCGKVLADKYNYYIEKANKIDENHRKEMLKKFNEDYDDNTQISLHNAEENDKKDMIKTYKYIESTYKKDILDELGLNKMCCRRHMISNVNMKI